MDVINLYREEILDHYQNPHNFGKIDNADVYAHQTNPLCGDEIKMWVKYQPNSLGVNIIPPSRCKILDIAFQGKGCAICIASASILTDFAKDKKKEQLTKFSENDMLGLLGITVSETRKKCAFLSLAVLKDCMR